MSDAVDCDYIDFESEFENMTVEERKSYELEAAESRKWCRLINSGKELWDDIDSDDSMDECWPPSPPFYINACHNLNNQKNTDAEDEKKEKEQFYCDEFDNILKEVCERFEENAFYNDENGDETLNRAYDEYEKTKTN